MAAFLAMNNTVAVNELMVECFLFVILPRISSALNQAAFDAMTEYLKEQMQFEMKQLGVGMDKTVAWKMLKELNIIRKSINS